MTTPASFAHLDAHVRYDQAPTDTPIGLRAMSLVPEDFAIMDGYPEVPEIWVKAVTGVSLEGETYRERPNIADVQRSSLVKFVPASDHYDLTTKVWDPVASKVRSLYQMDASGELTLSSLTWRGGREIFSADCLSMVDAQLSSRFNDRMDDAHSTTIAIAANLLGTGELFGLPNESAVEVTESGLTGLINAKHFSVDFRPFSSFVVFIVAQLTSDAFTLAIASNPNSIATGSAPSTDAGEVNLNFQLGSVPMNLLALDVWAGETPSIPTIVSEYSSALGWS